MAIPSQQIGWSQKSKLLWNISKQLENLIKVAGNVQLTTTSTSTTVAPTTTTTTTTEAPTTTTTTTAPMSYSYSLYAQSSPDFELFCSNSPSITLYASVSSLNVGVTLYFDSELTSPAFLPSNPVYIGLTTVGSTIWILTSAVISGNAGTCS